MQSDVPVSACEQPCALQLPQACTELCVFSGAYGFSTPRTDTASGETKAEATGIAFISLKFHVSFKRQGSSFDSLWRLPSMRLPSISSAEG